MFCYFRGKVPNKRPKQWKVIIEDIVGKKKDFSEVFMPSPYLEQSKP